MRYEEHSHGFVGEPQAAKLPGRGIAGLTGWALVAVLAVGASLGSAAFVERPSKMVALADGALAGQNVAPQTSLDSTLANVDRSITTAATRASGADAPRSGESIRLALSSMQRQINTLSARNDRLETELRQLRTMGLDQMATGSVVGAGDAQQRTSATNALRALAETESSQADPELSNGVNALRQESQRVSGVDLGSGISFDELRNRWVAVLNSGAEELEGLEARAVLRDGAQGLIAHLIVGPLSSANAATQLCQRLELAVPSGCKPVPFEGQPL